MSKYDDIINLPHPVSKKHKPMSSYNRAAQFAPFAALVGYDEVIKETGRTTADEIELGEDQINDINNKLFYLSNNKENLVNVTFFEKDKYKKGGAYLSIIGKIKKIDLDNGTIIFEDKNKILIKNIIEINIV
ncbi:MAG: hypothetical protein Q4E33_01735 [Erysipelotrichaceae bacterium]|nr:hypothetical protein [Erysipelotrichaceae bacterium]